jgi:hypothetical protein
MTKYRGIDEREIKCCCNKENCIESGISIDQNEEGSWLRFHFLQYDGNVLNQKTKTMLLNKNNAEKLISLIKSTL